MLQGFCKLTEFDTPPENSIPVLAPQLLSE
jgi:hypothetical protein